jgi:hypothetical protein
MGKTFWLASLITLVFPLAFTQKAEAPSLEVSLSFMKNTLAVFGWRHDVSLHASVLIRLNPF